MCTFLSLQEMHLKMVDYQDIPHLVHYIFIYYVQFYKEIVVDRKSYKLWHEGIELGRFLLV